MNDTRTGGRGGFDRDRDRDRGGYDRDRDRDRGGYDRRGPGRRREPMSGPPGPIDYKNVDLLLRFVDSGGRIRSRRRTRTNAKRQREITLAVKHARHLALLPYTGDHVRLFGE